jgi:hypothetical protein
VNAFGWRTNAPTEEISELVSGIACIILLSANPGGRRTHGQCRTLGRHALASHRGHDQQRKGAILSELDSQ